MVRQGRLRFRLFYVTITLYKRAGLRVLLNQRQQLNVRPSMMEVRLQQMFKGKP